MPPPDGLDRLIPAMLPNPLRSYPSSCSIGVAEGFQNDPETGDRLYLMNIEKMLAELRAEREHVEQAILVLERIAAGRGR